MTAMSNIDYLPIDLHCHSYISDGDLSPADVVARAAARGCRLLALTDHDDMSGIPLARAAALDYPNLMLLAGVEVSVTYGQHTLHIVGLDVDIEHPMLQAGLALLRAGRHERAQRMANGLAAVGIMGALEGAKSFAVNPDLIGRVHFARFLIQQGYAKDNQQVFKRYLVPGKPGYTRQQWATLSDALTWITAAGGLAVLAHPARYKMGTDAMKVLLTLFKQFGGSAIEVITSNHTASQVAQFACLAEKFDLMGSVGSDFHSAASGHIGLGGNPALPSFIKPVWARWFDESKL